ncbi:MAG: M20/M25/M40 family metallo-hydrolase [Vulcanibacillus sp.]
MVNRKRVIEEFIELVSIDSETGFERDIADYLIKKFTEFGLEVIEDNSIDKTGHGAGNIIATLHSNDNENYSNIYFTAHMDTVVPGKNIKAIIKGDFIESEGATILGSDDKAGLAAMIEAITVIKENGIPHGKVQFLITVGEESGLRGSKFLQKDLIEANYGFALDSNGPVGDIIVSAPTQARIETVVYGKSAHAGANPEDGISAIQVASKAVAGMKLGRIDSETTANIGMFQGGKATNIVCDRVDIISEARSINRDKLDRQIQHMKDVFEKTADDYSTNVDFTSVIMYPSFSFSEDHPLVCIAKKSVEAVGRKSELITSGGGSDANVMNGYGIPTINLGIGMDKIHTIDERIAIQELVKTPELIIELVKNSKLN